MAGKVIDVPYSINENDPNFTVGADIAAGVATGVEHLLGTFLCPEGLRVVVIPTSTLAMYLKDLEAAPAEFGDGIPIRVAHVDSAGAFTLDRIKSVYGSVKAFADVNSMKKFEDKFAIGEREKLLIYSTPASGSSIDVSACRFEIRCRRISKLLSI